MLEALGTWIEGSGSLVYGLAPLFTVAVAILPIPAEIPAVLNGMVFGPLWGSLVTWVCALVGAQISFELARNFGRPLGERVIPARFLDRGDQLVEAAGWPALVGLRLLPTVAFTALNWGAGLTSVRRTRFIWTTAVGILPGAIAFTATGSGLKAVFERSEYGYALYGVVAILVLLTFVCVCRWWPRRR